MTTPDVDPEEIVRRADRLHRIDFDKGANAICNCHAWTVPVPYNAVMVHAAHERHRAAEIVAALTRAGVITEPGTLLPLVVPPVPDNPGETWQEWGYRVTLPDGSTVDHWEEDEGCWDENDARKLMAEALADYEDGCTAVLIRRTAWYATSAWEVAP